MIHVWQVSAWGTDWHLFGHYGDDLALDGLSDEAGPEVAPRWKDGPVVIVLWPALTPALASPGARVGWTGSGSKLYT